MNRKFLNVNRSSDAANEMFEDEGTDADLKDIIEELEHQLQ